MSLNVVLVRTQDLVNIASVVRAMKNFELRNLRLVQPEEYEVRRIEGIAHGTGDLLKRVRHYDSFEEAVADCTLVAGMTARQRTAKRNVLRPRDAATELMDAAAVGPVALVLGPEDRGLTNAELDRCHRSIIIATNPEHPSMNIAQAFTVMAYELYHCSGEQPFKQPRRSAPPATVQDLAEVFDAAQDTLDAIEFFKTRNPEAIMRTVREVLHRTPLDARESKLIRAMCFEVLRYLERKGVR
ncbi:MAG: TrmJ/YjtD family RNA methyltransferase [Gemmatimonadales bacterium]